MRSGPTTGRRAWLNRLIEPHVLFPALASLVLAIIWATTANLIRVERANAAAASAAAALDLIDTYDAQVVRALREIDQTLKLVKYVYDGKGAAAALSDLKARGLLPPDVVFVVSIVNPQGAILASTQPAQGRSAAGPALRHDLLGDVLWIDQPRENASGEWTLQFGRTLRMKDGTAAGAVLVGVDASYFVSAYDPSILGRQGVLALLGTDGVFRARRTGASVTAGEAIDYSSAVSATEEDGPTVSLNKNSWDGVRRFTGTQQLYEFPLAVIVGLSEDEQMAATRRHAQVYLWRAGAGSGLLVLLTGILGWMSWQLARARVRENEAKLAHAVRIEYLAYHDGLTALPNRSLFNRLLGQAVSQAQRSNKQLAVAFIDLDRFKQINDTLGHEAGDELLKEVAVRLKTCLRDSDIVARLGGDEFVVLLTEMTAEHYAATVAKKIIGTIAKPFILLGQEFRVTASIGISVYPLDGDDEQTLTKNADIAMYQAKEDGKNNFQFYSKKLNANALDRIALESNLRHALEHGEFQLHYQAKRDIATGQITGMEALLRWKSPERGMVAPLQFMQVAEETGLIVPIGRWALQTACLQNVAWQKQGLPRLKIAVNLSERQFSDEHLLRDIAAILTQSGMRSEFLELEIHESLLIRNIERTLKILVALKGLGVKIAVDDFGAGFLSLSTLQQFPLDTIKIDRSYIRDIATRDEQSNLTEAIIAMGKSLSLTVVAQGVETKEQAEFLRQHACDEFQGFYFNRPVSAQQFTELLRAQEAGATYIGSRAALAKAAL